MPNNLFASSGCSNNTSENKTMAKNCKLCDLQLFYGLISHCLDLVKPENWTYTGIHNNHLSIAITLIM